MTAVWIERSPLRIIFFKQFFVHNYFFLITSGRNKTITFEAVFGFGLRLSLGSGCRAIQQFAGHDSISTQCFTRKWRPNCDSIQRFAGHDNIFILGNLAEPNLWLFQRWSVFPASKFPGRVPGKGRGVSGRRYPFLVIRTATSGYVVNACC